MRGWKGFGRGGSRELIERATPAQVDRYTTMWRKLLDIKGQPPEAHPGIEVESDRVEWGFLKGEHRFTYIETVNPAVNVWIMQLFNPLGSGLICVVERAWIERVDASAITDIFWQMRDTQAVSAGGFILPRDTRWFQGSFTATAGRAFGLLGRESIAAIPGGNTYTLDHIPTLAAGSAEVRNVPLVLAEGSGVGFESSTTASLLIRIGIIGYVRSRNPGEISPG